MVMMKFENSDFFNSVKKKTAIISFIHSGLYFMEEIHLKTVPGV